MVDYSLGSFVSIALCRYEDRFKPGYFLYPPEGRIIKFAQWMSMIDASEPITVLIHPDIS